MHCSYSRYSRLQKEVRHQEKLWLHYFAMAFFIDYLDFKLNLEGFLFGDTVADINIQFRSVQNIAA